LWSLWLNKNHFNHGGHKVFHRGHKGAMLDTKGAEAAKPIIEDHRGIATQFLLS